MASRSGTAQSVIAAYESGSREPALSTLSQLIAATGLDLIITLKQGTPVMVSPATGPLGRRVRRRRATILALANQHGVTDVRLFGSVARGQERLDSDIDFLVRLPTAAGLFTIARLQVDLEDLLRAPIDIVPDDGVKPRLLANIQRDLIAL